VKIRTNDEVVVITGRDRGKRGRVLSVLPAKNRVIVEGVNVVTRHLRRNPQNPQVGGRVQRPAAIHVSNVQLWSAADGKGVRVRMKGEGREKVRVSSKTGEPVKAGGKAKAGKTKVDKTKPEKTKPTGAPDLRKTQGGVGSKEKAGSDKPAGD
jgi:large subunit ribosomal protein L24